MSTACNIFVAGHRGLVGSAIVRALKKNDVRDIITRTRDELDLSRQSSVNAFFAENNISQVYLAAAKVGGIHANNNFPAEFIYQNLMIQSNIIEASYRSGVDRLLFLGSSCIYPKHAEQPITEQSILSGTLEPTNEPYAIAKIAGIKTCESYARQYGCDFRSVMPTNLYGPGDNFHPENSHVIPALMERFHKAVENGDEAVTIWGSGKPLREFLHVDDMAAASIHVMNLDKAVYQQHTQTMISQVNVGTGVDCTIRELAETMAVVTNFKGQLTFDASKPDGTARKVMDVSRLKELGWQAQISLKEGLMSTYEWYLNNQNILSRR